MAEFILYDFTRLFICLCNHFRSEWQINMKAFIKAIENKNFNNILPVYAGINCPDFLEMLSLARMAGLVLFEYKQSGITCFKIEISPRAIQSIIKQYSEKDIEEVLSVVKLYEESIYQFPDIS